MDCRTCLALILCAGLSCLGCTSQRQNQITPQNETTSFRPPTLSKAEKKDKKDGSRGINAEVKFAQFQENESRSDRLSPVESERMLTRARTAYQRALELDADNVEAALGLARVYATLGDHERATEAYNKAATRHPKNGQVWYELGMYRSQQRDFPGAIAHFRKSLEFDPENRRYANALAVNLFAAGQPQQSLQVLTRLHGEAKAHLKLARAHDRLGQSEHARAYLQMALQKDPRLADSHEGKHLMARFQQRPGNAAPVARVSYQEKK